MSLRGIIPLGLFLVLVAGFAIGLTRDPKLLPSEMINRPFPDFQLTSLYDEDKIITDASLKGQVSLVNVFGSWCTACVQEHPSLVNIARTGQVKLVGMNWRDEREKAKSWLERHKDPYDTIIFDADSQLAIDLGVTGAPETFIVDENGQIRYKHTGIITKDVWYDKLAPIIKDLEDQS